MNHPAVAFADAPGSRGRTASRRCRCSKCGAKPRRKAASTTSSSCTTRCSRRSRRGSTTTSRRTIAPARAPRRERRDSRAHRSAKAPTRARLIRVTPAQRRVAELVAQRWTVPVDAGGRELEAALRVLAGHFVLHSDAAAGEPVPTPTRASSPSSSRAATTCGCAGGAAVRRASARCWRRATAARG
ncbi:MAG: hypothetical protein MZW92_66890 [Comamonadaceae bacterium]|nr:hypothetical protein [Comamonadaceae bacterium]